MAKISKNQKHENLTYYLRLITNDEKYFIHSVNNGNGIIYSLTEKMNQGAIRNHTKFYNYDTMLAYLEGMVSMKNNYIKF